MATIPIYNERLKLVASALNLIGVGIFGLGVTAPLVSSTLGVPPLGNVGAAELAPGLLVWSVCAFLLHIMAQIVLGRLK